LRSYDQVIKLEQERLVYQTRLRSRYGRAWRRKAPVESLMPLRLARYGVPLAETAPAGLAAAGIEPMVIPAAAQQPQLSAAPAATPAPAPAAQRQVPAREPEDGRSQWLQSRDPQTVEYHGDYDPHFEPDLYEPPYDDFPPDDHLPEDHLPEGPRPQPRHEPALESPSEETGSFPIPVGPNRTRELGEGGGSPEPDEESFYQVFKQSINGSYPTPRELMDNVEAEFGLTLAPEDAKRMVNRYTNRHNAELEEDHIA
ncbi:hypothetical protein ABZZ79_37995, partial [Streptomyces sp. NPDC006458]